MEGQLGVHLHRAEIHFHWAIEKPPVSKATHSPPLLMSFIYVNDIVECFGLGGLNQLNLLLLDVAAANLVATDCCTVAAAAAAADKKAQQNKTS